MPQEYQAHWTFGAKVVRETKTGWGRNDTIEQLPSGEFIARVWSDALDFVHGPFEAADLALPCTEGWCECWRKDVKERHAKERDRLQKLAAEHFKT